MEHLTTHLIVKHIARTYGSALVMVMVMVMAMAMAMAMEWHSIFTSSPVLAEQKKCQCG